MQTEEFIGRIKDACPGLPPETAHDVCLITIRAICEHLSRDEAKRMASQLPDVLAKAAEAGGQETEQSYTSIQLEDFYTQLVARAEINHEDAQQVARAVAQTLRDAVSGGEMRDVVFDLPPELNQLLAPGA